MKIELDINLSNLWSAIPILERLPSMTLVELMKSLKDDFKETKFIGNRDCSECNEDAFKRIFNGHMEPIVKILKNRVSPER